MFQTSIEKNREKKPSRIWTHYSHMFVQYLEGELRFKSFPWFKTEAIFNFPIKLMMMPKTKKE